MTEGDEKRLAAETIAWLREREENCRRIAKAKVGSDRDGWLEDAAYFNSAITLLARATQAETALAVARERVREMAALLKESRRLPGPSLERIDAALAKAAALTPETP